MARNRYSATFRANKSLIMGREYTDTNKNRLIRKIRAVAEENRFRNGDCSWTVFEEDQDGHPVIVAAGGMTCDGERFRC